MKQLALLVLLGACGGGSSAAGEPVISSTVTASYDGHAFTPTFGFATIYKSQGLLGLADGAVHCGSETSPNPPSGSGVIMSIAALEVGSYPSAFIQIYRNTGNYMSVGSSGDLEITSVTADSVVGSIAYTFTDPQDNTMYSASGMFEIVHCP